MTRHEIEPRFPGPLADSLTTLGVMLKVMDCGIVESEFELQSRYYVHFQTNALGGKYEPPYPPSYGLDSCFVLVSEQK